MQYIFSYITCTIEASCNWLNRVHYFYFLQHQVTKHPIALRFGRKELFTIAPAFTFTTKCLVFLIQSPARCFKNKANIIRKTACETLRGTNASGTMLVFSVTQASVQYFPRRVGRNTCILLKLKSFFFFFFFQNVFF